MTTTVQNHHQDHHQARLVVRVLLQIGEATYALGDAELEYEIPAMRALLASPVLPVPVSSLPHTLREQITHLCARLGEQEPDYRQLAEQEATALLARLEAEEEDLLQTAARARTHPSPAPETPPVEPALIRQLKQRWRGQYQPHGSVDDLQRAWGHFKQRICGEALSDRAIDASQYEQLLAALASPAAERTFTR